MTKILNKPPSNKPLAIFWLAFALIIVAIACIRFEITGTAVGFLGMLVGAAVLALYFLVSLVVVIAALLRRKPVSGRRWTYLIVGAIPFAAVLLTVGVSGFRAPPIHDISTDLDNPPMFSLAKDDRGPGDHEISYDRDINAIAQENAYPDIQPLKTSLPPDQALDNARSLMTSLDWRVLGTDQAAGTVEGVYTSAIFGFEDDIVVRVTPINGGSRIDVRSASRVGQGDLGANARRIRDFLDAYREKFLQER